MKVLFEIVHPKHYYQFKNIIKLLNDDNEIKIIARKKDIVCQLLDAEGIKFEVYGGHGKTMKSKIFVLPEIFFNYLKIVKKFRPDIIVSKASPYAALIGKVFNIKSCIFPDSEVVTFNNIFVVPISDLVVTPNNFSLNYGKKHKRVSGFFEDSYLHPKFLDKEAANAKINGLPEPDQKYAVLRFVGWYANHDIGKSGFSDDEKTQLVKILKRHCEILITSEAPLPRELEKFRFKAPVNRMHHALFNAALYIGDSQTMATEAALCGTPAIRYNSFVGEQDMSNFKLLERKGMLSNCSTFDDVCQHAEKIIKDRTSKRDAQNRRKTYFKEVGDINQEITDILIALVSKDAGIVKKNCHSECYMDFTLTIYDRLLKTLRSQNYVFQPFATFMQTPAPRVIILRHDVDRRPGNALKTARLEHDLGIPASYYFRAVPESWDEAIIQKIAGLGHEIGYHYENLSVCKGDPGRAWEDFQANLAKLRALAPVTTICMHGSPMSRINNLDLWQTHDYKALGIVGEPYLDVDFTRVFYLTDTGRRWNHTGASIRDRVDSGFDIQVNSTGHLMALAREARLPERVMINTHPQRWEDRAWPWVKELVWQNVKNGVKWGGVRLGLLAY